MNEDLFALKIAECIYKYVVENHSLTFAEKKIIYEILSDDNLKVRQIIDVLNMISESIDRTPTNIIQFPRQDGH